MWSKPWFYAYAVKAVEFEKFANWMKKDSLSPIIITTRFKSYHGI